MCLFPFPNTDYNGVAYKHGVREFDCGGCPECMHKRANRVALRSYFESKSHAHNCMITLTYDTFMRDKNGKILRDKLGVPLENPVDPNLKVNQRDVQLFIKRLRKYLSIHYPNNERIKYYISAEYGSSTHRAHYHALIFGFDFPDRYYHKKSKRGNIIYMSNTLTKLWNHGICTVDSVNMNNAIARYCSKYLSKSRSDKTFSLSSQGIGVDNLLKKFNGRSYYIEGVEYPIPRVVWQRYIMNKYKEAPYASSMDYRYVNRTDPKYELSLARIECFRTVRDNDSQYQRYLSYWKSRGEEFNQNKLPIRTRILDLDDRKYHWYKAYALRCYDRKKITGKFEVAPGSNVGVSRVLREEDQHYHRVFGHLPFSARLYKASDTDPVMKREFDLVNYRNSILRHPVDENLNPIDPVPSLSSSLSSSSSRFYSFKQRMLNKLRDVSEIDIDEILHESGYSYFLLRKYFKKYCNTT
ncbi:replication initiator protein [Sigmofec virus UA08Rod_5530]|uniref:Replication initiator protein n=1 Tax=Sigmofec virus UA08Rod_5530 TaxID=2929427 RepID=A0A976N1E9_9VIRU|nr:replication initiator protein [Sigmofec virus UA08Rod_5530]